MSPGGASTGSVPSGDTQAPKQQRSRRKPTPKQQQSLLPARIPLLRSRIRRNARRAQPRWLRCHRFVPSGDSRPCPLRSWHSKFSSAGAVPAPGFVWQRSRIGSVLSPGQSPALPRLFPEECLRSTRSPPAPPVAPALSPRLLSPARALKGLSGAPHSHPIHEIHESHQPDTWGSPLGSPTLPRAATPRGDPKFPDFPSARGEGALPCSIMNPNRSFGVIWGLVAP